MALSVKKILSLLLGLAALWLGVRYLLPVAIPFGLGGLLALAAEPAVRLGTDRLKLRRWLAAGLGVSLTLILLLGILSFLGALVVRELGAAAGAVPDLTQQLQNRLIFLQDQLIAFSDRLPGNLGPLVSGSVLELLGSSSGLFSRLGTWLSRLATGLLGKLPGSALGLGTGVIAGYMISSRLPKLRRWYENRLPQVWYDRYLPALRRMGHALGGWLKAQLKLCGLTWGIVSIGFLILGIPYAPLWAGLVALVDAVPMLGTGIVLLPWALIQLLQGSTFRGVGLLVTYAAALVTRTVLEPRLVGKQIGLDPLVTLLAMYAGYRFFGILGLLLAPMVTAAAKTVTNPSNQA